MARRNIACGRGKHLGKKCIHEKACNHGKKIEVTGTNRANIKCEKC